MWIWSSDLDQDVEAGWLPKVNVDFLVQRYIRDKIFVKIRTVFAEFTVYTIQIVEKMPHLAIWKNPLKNFLDQDLEADDFRKLIGFSLSTDTSVVVFSRTSFQQFLPRCMECRHGLAMRFLSVRLSVKRVHCDKTEEKSVQIFIPCERSFCLLLWEEEWLVGATPSIWNFGSTGPRWSEIAEFEPIIARSASAVWPSEKSSN